MLREVKFPNFLKTYKVEWKISCSRDFFKKEIKFIILCREALDVKAQNWEGGGIISKYIDKFINIIITTVKARIIIWRIAVRKVCFELSTKVQCAKPRIYAIVVNIRVIQEKK